MNEVDVKIRKINETYMHVTCLETYMEHEISERFSFKVASAQHDPRVKRGQWDGIKRLYNRTHKRIYVGLLFELIKFLKKQEYTFEVDQNLINKSDISIDEIKELVKEFIKPYDNGKPIEPYDYQYEAVHYMLNAGRSICLAATSAGKSLSIYMAVRIYQMLDDFDGKNIVIIVPSTMLVEQLYADFNNYSNFEDSRWNVSTFCQKVSGKYSKNIDKQIVITTWQSLKNMPPFLISDAGAIFVDEVHTVKGPVLASLLESAVNCPVRHGLTGTLDDMESNILSAEGLLGVSKRIVTSKQIIDSGRATDVKVNVVLMDYDVDTKREYNKDQLNIKNSSPAIKYQSEINFINNLECRFNFIQNLSRSLKGNTIVLFDRVEEYGVPLYEDMKKQHRNTFLISGSVDGFEREKIRNLLEGIDDAIVYATSSIMSTGVSIKNLHNMVFCSSSKSKIRVLQSIGRLMRLHDSKEEANLYDLVDKLDYNGIQNFTFKHVEERIKFYSREKFKVKFLPVNLDNHKEERMTLM